MIDNWRSSSFVRFPYLISFFLFSPLIFTALKAAISWNFFFWIQIEWEKKGKEEDFHHKFFIWNKNYQTKREKANLSRSLYIFLHSFICDDVVRDNQAEKRQHQTWVVQVDGICRFPTRKAFRRWRRVRRIRFSSVLSEWNSVQCVSVNERRRGFMSKGFRSQIE